MCAPPLTSFPERKELAICSPRARVPLPASAAAALGCSNNRAGRLHFAPSSSPWRQSSRPHWREVGLLPWPGHTGSGARARRRSSLAAAEMGPVAALTGAALAPVAARARAELRIRRSLVGNADAAAAGAMAAATRTSPATTEA